MYKYGAVVRLQCKHAYEAAFLLAKMRGADLLGSAEEKDATQSPPLLERN